MFVLSSTLRPLQGAIWLSAALWAVIEVRQGTNHRPEAKRADGGSAYGLGLGYAAGIASALAIGSLDHRATIRPIHLVDALSLVLLWCAIILRWWCFRTLGEFFTLTVKTSTGQDVIDHGPYRVVRHPSYDGVLLAIVALGLVYDNYWSLLSLTVCSAAGILFRIRVEEEAMLRDVGDRYRTYASRRKRLIPFLW